MNKKNYFKSYIFPSIFAFIFFSGFQVMVFLLNEGDNLSYFLVGSVMLILVLGATGFTFVSQKRRFLDLLPFLIHPVFLFFGLTGLLYFNDQFILREFLILASGIAYFILFSEDFSDLAHQAHDGVKFLIIFMLYDTILEGVHFFGFSLYIALWLIFGLTLLFQSHLLWRLKAVRARNICLAFVIAGLLTLAAWILLDVYLLSSYLVLSLMILAVYYFCWGVLHHIVERNLTLRITIEYFLIALITLIMFFGLTTGF